MIYFTLYYDLFQMAIYFNFYGDLNQLVSLFQLVQEVYDS